MSDDDLYIFTEEEESLIHSNSRHDSWVILIVDDEPDVHQVTEFALRDILVFNRPITFLHAYSAKEGISILNANPDICVILLDVVMESSDAGLNMVKVIRQDLGLHALRIILRTGQPGQVPEVDTITQYDINDYKTKNELTRDRLLTAIITSIRSWNQIKQIEAGQVGLEKIIQASNQLIMEDGIEDFAEGVIIQLAGFLSLDPEGIICIEEHEDESIGNFDDLRIIAAAGEYRHLINHKIGELDNPEAAKEIQLAFSTQGTHISQNSLSLYFNEPSRGRNFVTWLSNGNTMEEINHHLLEIFCKNISLCAQNVGLIELLKDQAYRDPLLEIPNLAMLHQYLQDLSHCDEYSSCRVALIDIDRFGQLNDFFGHSYGDTVLKALNKTLRERFDPRIFIARAGADIFTLVGPEKMFDDGKLETLTEVTLDVENTERTLTCSIGIAPLQPGESSTISMNNAEISLKRAKSIGIAQLVRYSDEIGAAVRRHNNLLTKLQQAIPRNQLRLMYQPQFSMPDGNLQGFEALLRWKDDEGNEISPVEFIPIAEQGGIIAAIGEWVLYTALTRLKQLLDSGSREFIMAVNVSAEQLSTPDFVGTVKKALETTGVPPRLLELEITESVSAIGLKELISILTAFREMGISIAIDDFGTGYSSLSSIDQWPVNKIKIDKSFIQKLQEEENKGRIVDLIIPLSKNLALQTIAEGVETAEQHTTLTNMGCDMVQGYLTGRPMEADILQTWIKDRTGK